jgi:predicted RND superfamily exporter protein
MPDKKCPKCGKTFDESWKLCGDCGIELVVPHAMGTANTFSSKLRNSIRNIDKSLDSKMGKAVERADRGKESLEDLTKQATKKATEITEKAEKKALIWERKGIAFTRRWRGASSFNAFMDFILAYPKLIMVLILVTTLIIGGLGIPAMLDNISGDMKIYLPQGDESAEVLNEVNEDWSTDMIVLFVETPNKFDQSYGTNITDKAVLDEISAIEDLMDPNKEDRGEQDNIVWVLSISTIIKEINMAPSNIWEASIEELNPLVDPGPFPGDSEYAIPDNQDDIDQIVEGMPEDTKKLLAIDTNNDPNKPIWDSAGIILAVHKDADQEKVMARLYTLIDKYYIDNTAEEGDFNCRSEWLIRVQTGEVHCAMTPTGPVPMTEALTARTYQEFSVVLPAALLLICVMLLIFHRTWKIVLISGIPILCSLLITLGIMGLTGWVLSPQVILVAPILLALGVAYGLYIANRYSDERNNVPDRKERMKLSIRTTGKAIFLSAATTAVGFSSLMFVDMVPMVVLGFGLTVGILICYAITMLMVPSLVMLLNYEKKGKIRSIEKVAAMPVRPRRKIVIAAIAMTLISISLIPSIQANMNLTEMAPQDEPSIVKMDDYSREFGGGQLGMVIVKGSPTPSDDDDFIGSRSMKDIEVLDDIERFEDDLKQIRDPDDPTKTLINPPISVVDVMKLIKIPESIKQQIPMELIPAAFQPRVEEILNSSFWDAIHTAGQIDNVLWYARYPKSVQDTLINIFYKSLTPEMRGFLVNEDYSRALVYIDIPAMDAVKTKTAVDLVNKVVENHRPFISLTKLTGFAAIMVSVNDLIMENSLFSIVIALVIVFFVLIIIFRSLRYAALTMIPVSMVVAWEPLTLYMTGIDLNLITAMIGSIIVGIGIDYGIHMTERIRESGENPAGIKKAVETSGFSFFEATTTIVAGLFSIFLINIRSIQEFITMVIILLIFSMVAAMVILPAIYAWLGSVENSRGKDYTGETLEVEPEYGY